MKARAYIAPRSNALPPPDVRPNRKSKTMTRTFSPSAALSGLASLMMATLPFVALTFVGFTVGQF